MFEVIYLFVLAWAALPLVRTLMQGGGGNHIAFVHRLYRDAAYILAAVLGIVVFEAALGISLENYWFEELGQSHRYWLSLEYRVAIFFVVSLLVGLFVGANLRVLCRPYAVVPTKRAVDHRICARSPGRISRDAVVDSAHAVPRRHSGRRGRSGVRQRSFLLLVGVAPLRRHCRNRHRYPLRRDRALGGSSGWWLAAELLRSPIAPTHSAPLTRIEASPFHHRGRVGRSGRAGSGRAWFSAPSCASHWGRVGSWPAITSLWTDIRRSWPAPPMPTSISGYPDTTSSSHVGSRPL